jgi:TfoX/Sxy family transcriptional regulator of competence genes
VDVGRAREGLLGRLFAAGLAAVRPAVCTLVAIAYDEELAGRIRQAIGSDPELTEKNMFGGLAFLIRGNMAIAASSEGGAMVRVDPAQSDDLLATTKATLVNMRGRDMPGWLRVSSDNLRTDDQLARWAEIGIGYARSLPSKQ